MLPGFILVQGGCAERLDTGPWTGAKSASGENKGQATVARKHQFTAVFLVAAAAALAGTAAAQTTSGLEEIIVTAQKREQSLQDVGIAVTAFSDKQIRELGFTDSTDVVAMTPGLIYTTPNAESSVINFFLRGVGLNDFADANENPVAVYVDDVYRPASGGLEFPALRPAARRGAARAAGNAVRPQHDRRGGPLHQQAAHRRARRLTSISRTAVTTRSRRKRRSAARSATPSRVGCPPR